MPLDQTASRKLEQLPHIQIEQQHHHCPGWGSAATVLFGVGAVVPVFFQLSAKGGGVPALVD